MAVPAPPFRKRTRWPRRLLRVAAILLVALGLLYVLRGPLLSRPLAILIAHEASQALGARCQVTSVSGDLFRHVEIQGFTMTTPMREGPLRELSVRQVVVTYNLLRLVRGQALQALSLVELDELTVNADATRPARASHPAAAPTPTLGSILPFPLPSVQLTGQLTVSFPLDGKRIGHLHIAAVRLLGDGGSASLDLNGVTLPELGIDQERWSCRADFPGPGSMHLQAFGPLAGVMLKSVSIIPDGANQRIEAQIGIMRSRLDMTLAHDHLGVRLAAFDLASLPPWARALSPAPLPSAGVINGMVAMPLGHDDEAVSIDAHLQGLVWRALLPAEVVVQGTVSPQHLQLDHIAFDNLGTHVAGSDIAIDPGERWVAHAPAHFDCAISDVARLLQQLELPLPTGICTAIPLSLQADLQGHGQTIDHLQLQAEAGSSHLHLDVAAELPRSHRWRELRLQRASWDGHLQDLDFPCLGPAWGGMVEGSGDAAGPILQLRGHGGLQAQGLLLMGHQVGDAELALNLDYPTCEVTKLEIRQPQATVHLTAAGNPWDRSLDHGECRIDLHDLSLVNRQLPQAPALRGELHAQLRAAHITAGSLNSLLRSSSMQVQLTASDVVLASHQVGSVALEASLDHGHLELSNGEIAGAVHALAALSAVVDATGSYDVKLHQLDLSARDQPAMHITLRHQAELRYRAGRPPQIDVQGLDFDALGGHVSINGHVGPQVDALIRIYRMQPWSMLPSQLPPCQGMINCECRLTGTPQLPLIALHVGTVGLRVLGHGAYLRLDARQDAQGCVLDAVDARISGVLDALGTGSWPVHIGINGSTRLPGTPRGVLHLRAALVPGLLPARPGLPRTGIATLSATSDGTGARLDLSVRDCVLGWSRLVHGGHAPSDEITAIDAHVTAGSKGWQSRLQARDSAGLELDLDGTGKTAFDPARPYRFMRSVVVDPLSVTASMGNLQMARLQRFAPWLVHLGGLASGTLHADGTVAHPHWAGELAIRELAMKSRSDVPALTDGQGLITVQGYQISISHLQGRMGYAPIGIQGRIDLSGSEPKVQLQVNADDALVIQNQSLRLRVAGAISLLGPLSALHLNGKLKVVDALYSQPFELLSRLRPTGTKEPQPAQDQGIKLFSVRDEPLASLAFNVDLHATQSLHVRTNLFSGNASMDLHLGGTGLSPIPTGQIWVDDAKVRLPFSSLNLTHADMVFTANNPFFPHLDAMGETRSKGYDLSVRVSGNMPNVVVTVESDPPLSNNDGIMLLTTGLTEYDRDQAGASRSQLTSVGEYLAKEIWGQVSAPPDPDAKPSLIDLDRLDLSIGQELSITGQETIQAEYELNSHFYLRGERDLFNEYNLMLVWRIHER